MAAISNNNQIPIEKYYYYFDILLTETYKSLGQVEAINTNSNIIGELTEITFEQFEFPSYEIIPEETITITGITKSRLEEVKTYNGDFKVGTKGVTQINNTFISYSIVENGTTINYTTFLDGLLTIFSADKKTNNFDYQNVIRNDSSVFVDLKKTINTINIIRNNLSVYEYMDKINNCDELSDLLDIF